MKHPLLTFLMMIGLVLGLTGIALIIAGAWTTTGHTQTALFTTAQALCIPGGLLFFLSGLARGIIYLEKGN